MRRVGWPATRSMADPSPKGAELAIVQPRANGGGFQGNGLEGWQ